MGRESGAVPALKTFSATRLCALVDQPPSGADWPHEIKSDGWRVLARKQGDDVRIYIRGGIEWSEQLNALSCDASSGRVVRCVVH